MHIILGKVKIISKSISEKNFKSRTKSVPTPYTLRKLASFNTGYPTPYTFVLVSVYFKETSKIQYGISKNN